MALPTPPPYTNPIPNNPFNSPLAYVTRGAYYPLTVGSGLNVDPITAIITASGGGSGGVTSISAGPGINVSASTGNVAVTNAGVISVAAGSGISVSTAAGIATVTNLNNGTVTSVDTGAGLTGGPFSVSGTISLDTSGVTANTYTNPTITVDAYGRITLASSNPAVSSISVTAPITISGTTTPTIGILPATTTQAGAVQLSDAVNDPASVCAASTAAVMMAYDLAADAIPCAAITAKGALLSATAPGAVTALAVGTDGQALFACNAAPSGLCWDTMAGTPAATPTTLGTLYGCSNASNTSVGCNAFLSGGGGSNAALGLLALSGGNTGFGNVAVGVRALCSNTTASANVGVGLRALCKNTVGESNVAVGPQAICSNTFGSFNVAVGSCALCVLDGGDNNVAVGLRAGINLTTGCNNVAIGCNVLVANGSGNDQLAIGFSPSDNWLTGTATKAIQPGAGIIDCAASCGTANMVLTSQGNAVEWKSVSSSIADPNYGNFLSSATQTIVTPGTPQAVELDTVVAANNFTLGGTSQITAAVDGIYNLQFSIQLLANPGGGGDVEIWLAKNGNPVPDSNTRFAIKNTNEAEFVALNYVETLDAGDYLELIWSTADIDNFLFAASAPTALGGPAIPSVILTIVPVGA